MNNILLISTGTIAEVLCVTPALSVLKRNFPAADITVLTDRPDIFKNNPSVKEILQPQSFVALLKKFKAGKFDLAILFTPSLKYSLLIFMARIAKRIAPHNFYTDNLMTNPVKSTLPAGAHMVKVNMELLSPLFIFSFPAKPVLYVSKKENEWAKKYLSDIGILPKDKFICINPGSPRTHLNWPKQHYATLIDNIAVKYPQIKVLLICNGKSEVSTANEIYWRSIRKPFILREMLPLNNFISLLNRANMVISNYSAPAHIAAALGKKVITFYPALESSAIIKPYSDTATVLEPKKEKCKKCQDKDCLQYCMRDISVAQTEEVFDKMIADVIKQKKGVLDGEGTFGFFDN